MNKQELLLLSWENLWRMKFRTILTIIGVVIGTASIIVMVSIGSGAQKSIVGELSNIGSITTLQVYPDLSSMGVSGLSGGKKDADKLILNDDAIDDIKRIDGVTAVTPVINLSGVSMETGRDQYSVSLMGLDYKALDDMRYNTTEGKKPNANEETSVILGQEVLSTYSYSAGAASVETSEIKPVDLIGKRINLVISRTNAAGEEEYRTEKVKVTGVLEATGGSEDYSIIASDQLVNDLNEWKTGVHINFDKSGYSEILVTVEDSSVVTAVTAEIEAMEFTVFFNAADS